MLNTYTLWCLISAAWMLKGMYYFVKYVIFITRCWGQCSYHEHNLGMCFCQCFKHWEKRKWGAHLPSKSSPLKSLHTHRLGRLFELKLCMGLRAGDGALRRMLVQCLARTYGDLGWLGQAWRPRSSGVTRDGHIRGAQWSWHTMIVILGRRVPVIKSRLLDRTLWHLTTHIHTRTHTKDSKPGSLIFAHYNPPLFLTLLPPDIPAGPAYPLP